MREALRNLVEMHALGDCIGHVAWDYRVPPGTPRHSIVRT